MTVNTITNKITYTANGATTQWTFPFPAVDESYIKVSITNNQGLITFLPSSGFSVFLNPPIDPNPTSVGGFVTILPPVAVGNTITILRMLPALQSTSISNQSIVYPPVIEQEFDYLTLLCQEATNAVTDIIGLLDRFFGVGPTDPVPAKVPPVGLRAGQAAFWDMSGNLTSGSIPGPGVFISSAMIPVVEATSIPLALAALGFSTGDIKFTHKAFPDDGWIFWVDGTIGNTFSGASIRANPDTQNLFSLYFSQYADSTCPLMSSAGTVITRASQGTAAAAFAAQCRMSLPKISGRVVGGTGAGAGLTSRSAGAFTGVESVTPSIATTAPHGHDFGPFTPPQNPITNYPSGFGFANVTFSGPDSFGYADILPTGGGQPSNVMQPTIFINIMVKL